MSSNSVCGILSLPLEVRQVIYGLCYLGPFPTPKIVDENESKPPQKKRRLNRPTGKAKKGHAHSSSNCRQPAAHLNLSMLCRQIRNEYFPIFTTHHAFRITDPLIFANKYLAYTPPHRYSQIRYLQLFWRSQVPQCNCQTEYVGCRLHAVSSDDHFLRHIRNLTYVVEEYPELFNSLEVLRFNIGSSSMLARPNQAQRKLELFENIILLLRKLDQINSLETEDRKGRKYLVVPHHSPSEWWNFMTMYLNIFAVSEDVWTTMPDGQVLVQTECAPCDYLPNVYGLIHPFRSSLHIGHGVNWNDADQIAQAIRTGKLVAKGEAREPEAGRNWKVIFPGYDDSSKWDAALSQLGSNEKAVFQKSKHLPRLNEVVRD